MVLTPSSLLCVCRVKLLSAEWFHNSSFQFSLAFDCLELFHTVHVVVCYVVHSFHQQMAYATPSQIKKRLNFIVTHKAGVKIQVILGVQLIHEPMDGRVIVYIHGFLDGL